MNLLELKKQYNKAENKEEFIADLVEFLDSKNKDTLFGGLLSVKHIKGLINNSYKKKADDNFDGWILDKELTKGRSKVYYNPQTKKTVVAHSGTDSLSDWGNNLVYGLFGKKAYQHTSRYKEAEAVQKRALQKYGATNLSTLSHSQSGLISELLGQKGLTGREAISLNKATRIGSNVKMPNQYDIRSTADIVSNLNPFQSKSKNDVIIPKQSYNPLTEHSPDILDRLDPEMMIGQGLKLRKRRSKAKNKQNQTKM